MEMTPEFLEWLHDVTSIGYDRNIMISAEHAAFMSTKFKEGFTPLEAVQSYIDFKTGR